MSSPNIKVGNKVLFIGGPEAGNVRIIPESAGDMVRTDADYVYRLYKIQMGESPKAIFFAYPANEDPVHMMLELWREYSPAAQIRRETETKTYNELKPA